MITISLCMIVKNEEDVLARCLDSVADIVDEINIVDTGSTDRTREIAARYTDRIFDFRWIDDFSAARNFSFSKATMAYTMWLDADDLLTFDNRENLKRLKETLDPMVDMVMMRYHTAFDELGNPVYSYYRERLVKTALHLRWQGAVHEVISPYGHVQYEEIAVTHSKLHPSDPDRNLRIFEGMLSQGKTLEPREQFYYARELYYHARYLDALDMYSRFLDEGNGWLENEIEACLHMSWCHYALGEDRQALHDLLRSLMYDIPRAEICCAVGGHFFKHQAYRTAIFWYETALHCQRNDRAGGFVQPDCYSFIPCLQLCVCYDRMGDRKRAEEYNEKAALFKPDNPAVLYNRAYFQQIPLQSHEDYSKDNKDRI